MKSFLNLENQKNVHVSHRALHHIVEVDLLQEKDLGRRFVQEIDEDQFLALDLRYVNVEEDRDLEKRLTDDHVHIQNLTYAVERKAEETGPKIEIDVLVVGTEA